MIQYPDTNCDCYGILFTSRKKLKRGKQPKASSYTDKDAADRLLLHKLRPPICHVLQPYVQSAIQRLDYEGRTFSSSSAGADGSDHAGWRFGGGASGLSCRYGQGFAGCHVAGGNHRVSKKAAL